MILTFFLFILYLILGVLVGVLLVNYLGITGIEQLKIDCRNVSELCFYRLIKRPGLITPSMVEKASMMDPIKLELFRWIWLQIDYWFPISIDSRLLVTFEDVKDDSRQERRVCGMSWRPPPGDKRLVTHRFTDILIECDIHYVKAIHLKSLLPMKFPYCANLLNTAKGKFISKNANHGDMIDYLKCISSINIPAELHGEIVEGTVLVLQDWLARRNSTLNFVRYRADGPH